MTFFKKHENLLVPLLTSTIALIGAIYTAWYIGSSSLKASIIAAEKSTQTSLEIARLNNIALTESTNKTNKNLLDSTRLAIEGSLKISEEGIKNTLEQIKVKHELDILYAKEQSNIELQRKKRNSVAFLNSYVITHTTFYEAQLAIINEFRSTNVLKKTDTLANKFLQSQLELAVLVAIDRLMPAVDMDTINQHTKYITTDNSMKVLSFFLLAKVIADIVKNDLNSIQNNFSDEDIVENLSSHRQSYQQMGESLLSMKRQATNIEIEQLNYAFKKQIRIGIKITIELNKYLGRNNTALEKKLDQLPNDDNDKLLDDLKSTMGSLLKELEKNPLHK